MGMTTIDLGRRAAACSKWRWMIGMRDTDGAICVGVEDGRPTLWWYGACGGEVLDEDLPSDEPTVPDLSDPSTVGAFAEGLLLYAWGHDVTIMHVDGPNIRSTTISARNGQVLFKAEGLRPERLVLALEYAP